MRIKFDVHFGKKDVGPLTIFLELPFILDQFPGIRTVNSE